MNLEIKKSTAAAIRSIASPILTVRNVEKHYWLYQSAGDRLLRILFGRLLPGSPERFTALTGVSFDLMAGDALAVIGRNGAGKSTLLQILAGTIDPTSGTISTPAKIAGLLELGSGFNPEFSGRENVFINGAILGMTRGEVLERLDGIIAFAAIGDYIDRAVKTYSSGMFLRLAFSVAIHSEPELLLVDEALAVGDIFFRQKCYAKLAELRESGTSIILVTHSMSDAAEFCNRGIVLSKGAVAFAGTGKEAVEYYFHNEKETPTGSNNTASARRPLDDANAGERLNPAPLDRDLNHAQLGSPPTLPASIDLRSVNQQGSGTVRALQMSVTDLRDAPRRVFAQGEWLRLHLQFQIDEDVSVPLVGIQLINSRRILVHGTNSLQFSAAPPTLVKAGTVLHCVHDVCLDLETGEYTIEVGLAELPPLAFARRHVAAPADIAPQLRLLCHVGGVAAFSIVLPAEKTPCIISHYGIARLASEQEISVFSQSQVMP